jgi:hypothetical protein
VVTVKGSIASLKVALTLVLIGTPVAPLALMVPVTVGTVVSAGLLPDDQCPVSPPPHAVMNKTLRIKIDHE